MSVKGVLRTPDPGLKSMLKVIYYSISDKFDQFWAVNRRLMEVTGESDGFKSIPGNIQTIRVMYQQARNTLLSPCERSKLGGSKFN